MTSRINFHLSRHNASKIILDMTHCDMILLEITIQDYWHCAFNSLQSLHRVINIYLDSPCRLAWRVNLTQLVIDTMHLTSCVHCIAFTAVRYLLCHAVLHAVRHQYSFWLAKSFGAESQLAAMGHWPPALLALRLMHSVSCTALITAMQNILHKYNI